MIRLKVLRMKRGCLFVAAVLLTSTLLFADYPVRKLTVEEAHQLAYAALGPQSKRLPGLGIEQVGADNPEPCKYPEACNFYFFNASWGTSDPPQGGTVDWFAVDAITGDVWNGIVCRQFRSRSLTKLQCAVRKRIGLTEREYRRLKRQGPMCPDEYQEPASLGK